MFGKLRASLKTELASYSRFEQIFILCAMLCSFFICSEHAVTKPTSYSAFVTFFSAKQLPYAWLLMIPINVGVVSLYNRFLHVLGCMRMLMVSVFFSMSLNIISGYLLGSTKFLPFFLFIWKDISVLLFFQQLWSVIHATVRINKAQYLYGMFFGIGGIGAILGSLIPSFFAIRMGSSNLLFLTVPFYISLVLCYKVLLWSREKLRQSGFQIQEIALQKSDTQGGIELIKRSQYLRFILLIVVLMQVGTTFVEYQMNTHVQNLISGQDLRTQYYGKLFAIVNIVNASLQFVGSFLVLKLLGLKKTHILVPLLLACNALGFIFLPVFEMIAISFVTIKSFDYSIFAIIKEMLYIPLSVDEKFKAKAVIDVFAYRTAKGFGSLLVLALQLYVGVPLVVSIFTCAIFVIWALSCVLLFKTQETVPAKQ